MRTLTLSVFVWGLLFAACANSTEGESPGTGESDAATSADSGKRSDSSITADDAATVIDSGGNDSTVADSAKDVTTSDTGATDSGSKDAAADAPKDAADAADAFDAGPVCVPPAGNFARCGVPTATSEYSGYEAPQAFDGDIMSSWYADTGACPSNTCPGSTINVAVSLNVVRTIGRVKIFGARDFAGYDTLTARIELLNAANAVVHTADVTPTGTYNDVDHVVSPAVASVKTVRVIVLTGEATGPGIAEVEAFAN